MTRTTGTYYDGVSSVPHAIEIVLEEGNGKLNFELPVSGSSIWKLDEVTLERSGVAIHLHPWGNKASFVKIDNEPFITALYEQLRLRGHHSWYQKLINVGLPIHLTIGISLLALIAGTYIYILPWVGEKSTILIPESYDNKIGSTFYEEFSQYSTIDTVKTEILNKFAQQLTLQNTKEFNFVVIRDATVNAFALPDGHIVVFTGILDKIKNYDELAGLLSHEAVHINKRHSMKMLCRNLSGYLFVSAVLSDVNGIMAILGENIRNLHSLSYSREFEKEADMSGLSLLAANCIDPMGMTRLLSHLRAEELSITIPAFLSSHPITQHRIAYIESQIKSCNYQVEENPELKDIFERLKD